MERYLCIHCHFYQPPRENPWLEAVEQQDSAYPYHDWNERITAECYAANTASRILDPENRIEQIVNNYQQISFNFGPTLLSWMEEHQPAIYEKILAADRESRERFGGHGSALAQAFNHMILPLASRRDRRTQVIWGIRDFKRRFGRDPEGMWLPEAAVDLESLEILAEHGIKFTILAPHQARQARMMRRGTWRNVEGAMIDPTKAYLCLLPSGRAISLFFYDGPISRAVAFEGLLSDGENFARRLIGGFNDARKWPQLMHIATDGETYGHHHRHGDMALAYALHYIESRNLAKITNYGQYLALYPPTTEVQIIDRTSWSCAHGVERWQNDCGCSSGRLGWNQQWRQPLREALDFLRDSLAGPFAEQAGALLKDPWAARDDYIAVVEDRSFDNTVRFMDRHARQPLDSAQMTTALKLLEIERHAMLMYTSCGWFFDELSGIETVQVIFYAARALQLADELFGNRFEQPFLERLRKTHSNLPELGTGEDIYHRQVKPATLDLPGVAAHYAISSLFQSYARDASVYCYDVERLDYQPKEAGRARAAVGHVRIQSRITLEESAVSFGLVHLGDHNLNAGVRPFAGPEAYESMTRAVLDSFEAADMPATLRAIDSHFPGMSYSIRSLFRDERRRVIDVIMEQALGETEASYRALYETHAPLMRFLAEVNMPLPRVLRLTAEFVVNSSLRRELQANAPDLARISTLLDAARRDSVSLDAAGLGFAMGRYLIGLMEALAASPHDLEALGRMAAAVRLARSAAFEVDLWRVQNLYWDLLQREYPQLAASAAPEAQEWAKRFAELGEQLGIRVSPAPSELPAAA